MDKQKMGKLANLENQANRTVEEEALRVSLVELRDTPEDDKEAFEAAEKAVEEAEKAGEVSKEKALREESKE